MIRGSPKRRTFLLLALATPYKQQCLSSILLPHLQICENVYVQMPGEATCDLQVTDARSTQWVFNKPRVSLEDYTLGANPHLGTAVGLLAVHPVTQYRCLCPVLPELTRIYSVAPTSIPEGLPSGMPAAWHRDLRLTLSQKVPRKTQFIILALKLFKQGTRGFYLAK